MTPQQRQQYAGQSINCTKCQRPFTVDPAGGMSAPAAAPGGHLPPGFGPPAGGMYGGQPGQDDAAYFPPPNNGMATASLVLGLILCVPLCSLLAIIFGIIGIVRANNPSMRGKGKGVAISGLVLGCLGLLIAPALLIAILLPSLNMARERANQMRSAANLRWIGQACMIYSNQYGGAYPPDEGALLSGGMTLSQFVSPPSTTSVPLNLSSSQEAAWVDANSDYVYLGAGKNNAMPPNAVLAYERLGIHHGTGANVLFGDGHVTWMTIPQIQAILAQQGVTPQQ
jgi:prepilin-type processing-associated H-X9-DG protein